MAGSGVPTFIKHKTRGVVRTDIVLTTDATGDGGDIAATVVGVGFGRIVGCFYDGGGDASAVITVKDARTGATLFTYTTGTEGTPTRFRPTTNVVDTAGATITAADTAPNIWRDIMVAGKVTVEVANMGVSESARFAILVDESGVGDLAITV